MSLIFGYEGVQCGNGSSFDWFNIIPSYQISSSKFIRCVKNIVLNFHPLFIGFFLKVTRLHVICITNTAVIDTKFIGQSWADSCDGRDSVDQRLTISRTIAERESVKLRFRGKVLPGLAKCLVVPVPDVTESRSSRTITALSATVAKAPGCTVHCTHICLIFDS